MSMRVGVFTPLLSQIPLDAVLKKLAALQINTVELATGNYPGDAHCKLSMLENPAALADFKRMLADHGFTHQRLELPRQSAASRSRTSAKQHREVSRKTILLAEKLGVSVMVDFSGCPGDSPNAKAPNWVTCPWPPDFLQGPGLAVERSGRALLDRAREVRRRSWREDRRRNASGLCRLQSRNHAAAALHCRRPRSAATSIPAICSGRASIRSPPCAFWADAIFHVHAKDTQIYPANLPRTGVLDTKPYTDERNRSWIFRTCGYGHGAEWWSEFISTLRMFGYDSVISIEHEDSLLSPGEGLTKAANFLNSIVIREQPAAAWWS